VEQLFTSWSTTLEELTGSQLFKKSPAFVEPESSLPHLQELANCPYPELDQFSPCPPIPYLENPSEYYPSICMWSRTTFNFVFTELKCAMT
jgi:hypothetical protein